MRIPKPGMMHAAVDDVVTKIADDEREKNAREHRYFCHERPESKRFEGTLDGFGEKKLGDARNQEHCGADEEEIEEQMPAPIHAGQRLAILCKMHDDTDREDEAGRHPSLEHARACIQPNLSSRAAIR